MLRRELTRYGWLLRRQMPVPSGERTWHNYDVTRRGENDPLCKLFGVADVVIVIIIICSLCLTG